MIKRAALVVLVIVLLMGLIFYSQHRPPLDRVSGFIEADEVRLGSRVGGRVRSVLVEEGDQVKRGQVLVELEPYDLLAREREARQRLAALEAELKRLSDGLREEEVAQAKARYDQLSARFDLMEAGPRQQEIEAARGRLTAADAGLKLARQTFERRKELFENNTLAREELDQASEALSAAIAQVSVRKNELNLLESGTREEEIREAAARKEEARLAWQLAEKGFRKEAIEQARASRDAADAALAVILEQKNELQIYSPIDGIVEACDLQTGDLTAPGAPVMTLMDREHLWVRAYIPQNRIALKQGQKLWVTVDAIGNERLPGKVAYISRQAEFSPSNVQTIEERSRQVFRIKVNIEIDDENLRPGMTADIWLDGDGESE